MLRFVAIVACVGCVTTEPVADDPRHIDPPVNFDVDSAVTIETGVFGRTLASGPADGEPIYPVSQTIELRHNGTSLTTFASDPVTGFYQQELVPGTYELVLFEEVAVVHITPGARVRCDNESAYDPFPNWQCP